MLTMDAQLSVFAERPQRRILLDVFRDTSRDDTPVESDSPESAEEYVELLFDVRHFHLPRLEEQGYVDYDRDEHTVTRGPEFDEVEPLLELVDEYRDALPDDWV